MREKELNYEILKKKKLKQKNQKVQSETEKSVIMVSNKSFKFDKFDQKKPVSEMTRLDVIKDFVIFILISAGYVIRVRYFFGQIYFARVIKIKCSRKKNLIGKRRFQKKIWEMTLPKKS